MGLLKALFGDYSQKEIKRIRPLCDKVLALEEKYKAMGEEELKGQTDVLRDRLSMGESLDDILPDAFAVCREATGRVLGTPHYPVQILGGLPGLYPAGFRPGEGGPSLRLRVCVEDAEPRAGPFQLYRL